MTDIADLQQRARALDPRQSFIVEAPAGSGKTELLTQRLLTLLVHCQQPEEILAITFTRKAAAEMRHRVLNALALAEQDEPEATHAKHTWQLARSVLQHDARHEWNLRLAPQRLQIFTFDSLCARLAKALPLHSRLGAAMEVSEDAGELYQQAVDRLFALLDSENKIRPALINLLRHRDNNFEDLRGLFVAMLARRDAWLPLLGGERFGEDQLQHLQVNLQHLIEDYLQKAFAAFAVHQREEVRELIAWANANFAKAYPDKTNPYAAWFTNNEEYFPKPGLTELARWKALCAMLLTNTGSLRKRITRAEGFPAGKGEEKIYSDRIKVLLDELAQNAALITDLQEVQTLPSANYDLYQWEILGDLTAVLPMLVAQFKVVCAENGSLDFSEISQAAIVALGEDDQASDLALRLDYRINHILVDEFQDTSTSQILLLEKLTRGWQPDDGHTLFCVGDAMQSIYSFRNARVSLFLACKQYGLGGLPLENLQLSANFRSQHELVAWNNQVFSTVFPARDDIGLAAVAYTPAQAVLEALPEQAVNVHCWNAELPQQEAGRVVEIVQQTQTQNPQANIAILLRKRAHADHLLPALQAANITYQAIELGSLTGTSTVQDLLALTRALLDVSDRIAWLAILRAPWCGLALSDLEALANSGQQSNEETSRSTQPPVIEQIALYLEQTNNASLERVYRCLQQTLAARQRLSLRQWLEGCWRELGGEACLQTAEEKLNAQAFFNEIEKLETRPGISLNAKNIERALARQYAAANPGADSRLQIMTMHKSKGLEFDVVILPSLHTGRERNDNELLQWQDRIRDNGEQEILLAPIQAIDENASDELFDYLKDQKKRRRKLEDARLLYVACTRAKRQLHLLGGLKPSKKDPSTFDAPAASSFFARLAPHIEQHFSVSPLLITAVPIPENVTETTGKPAKRLPAHWQPADLGNWTRLPHLLPSLHYNEEDQQLDLLRQDASARHVGTLVHALICDLHQSDFAVWQNKLEQDKSTLLAIWSVYLAELGLGPAQSEAGARKTWHLLASCFSAEPFRWLFSPEHKLRLSEYPIGVRSGQGSQHLVVDLLLVDNNSTLWIIDYKTSEPRPEQKLEDFIAEEKAQYADKMALYKKAIGNTNVIKERAGEIREIKVALYFPLAGKLAEL